MARSAPAAEPPAAANPTSSSGPATQDETTTQQQQQQQEGGGIMSKLQTVMRVLMVWYLLNTLMGVLFPTPHTAPEVDPIKNPNAVATPHISSQQQQQSAHPTPTALDLGPLGSLLQTLTATGEQAAGLLQSDRKPGHIHPEYRYIAQNFGLRNLWRDGSKLQLEIFLSPQEHMTYDELSQYAALTQQQQQQELHNEALAYPQLEQLKHPKNNKNNNNNEEDSSPSSNDHPSSPTPVQALTTKIYGNTVYYQWDDSVSFFGNDPYQHTATVDLFDVNQHYLQYLLTNNTLYSHIFIYQYGLSPSTQQKSRFTGDNMIYLVDSITRYVYKPLRKEKKNLISSASSTTTSTPASSSSADVSGDVVEENQNTALVPQQQQLVEEQQQQQQQQPTGVIRNYLVPTLATRILYDFTSYGPNQVPALLHSLYKILPNYKGYVPPAYIDRFWVKNDDFVLLNYTNPMFNLTNNNNQNNNNDNNNDQQQQYQRPTLNFTISYAPTTLLRFQTQKQIDQAWKQQEMIGLSDARQTDQFKEMILDTNPWLLLLTMVVSLLHSLFEFLAFKNDISHWKNLQTGRGLSVYTLFWNALTQAIIFLYLLDNDTSYVVLISTGVGVLIEAWKITKARDIKVNATWPFVHFDKTTEFSDDGDDTDEHDKVAFKYLGVILFPLALGYTGYSLIYNEFTGWYSFLLSTTVSFIYMFGFIPMTAQLFINYQLKSTAHIPVRVFVYKTLNTFVDDLFSFVIKMPWLHRLACLRDDAVFLVLLYQKWAYRVDYSRANEFGQVFDAEGKEIVSQQEYDALMKKEEEKKKAAKKNGNNNNNDDDKEQPNKNAEGPVDTNATADTGSDNKKSEAINNNNNNNNKNNNNKTNDETKNNKNAAKKAKIQAAMAKTDDTSTSPQQGGKAPYMNKWGETEEFVEEVPAWVEENQKKLREMRKAEEERMKVDPVWRAKREQEHLEQMEMLKKRFGPPKEYDPKILEQFANPNGTAPPPGWEEPEPNGNILDFMKAVDAVNKDNNKKTPGDHEKMD